MLFQTEFNLPQNSRFCKAISQVIFKLIGLYVKSFWLEKKYTKSNGTTLISFLKISLCSPKMISLQSRLEGSEITLFTVAGRS